MNHSENHKNLNGKCKLLGTVDFSGIKADIILGGVNSPMTVMVLTAEDGSGAPAHISHGEDKVFLINEGQMTFLIGDKKITADAGESIFVSKGTIHSFSAIVGNVARVTLVSTPGRHDQFFQAMSDLPTPHRMEDVSSICERFGQTIVGPVVEA